MILQIHDELVLSVPESEVAHVTKLVTECMTGIVTGWDVPVTVSNTNWQKLGRSKQVSQKSPAQQLLASLYESLTFVEKIVILISVFE